jgi:hypothetical protein
MMSVQQRFTEALDTLIEQVKADRAVLAAILCGSLSHDTVWSKSDIDLVLVTIDDKKIDAAGVALNADGVNIHAILMSRTDFRKAAEGAIRSSFVHSFLTKGRLLYTHDPTIEHLCERLKESGERDRQLQLLRAGMQVLGPLYKAHKWLITRGDLDYTALWILYAATSLAQIEVLSAGLLVDREVIPQAQRLNPALFNTVYTDLLNTRKSRKSVEAALGAIDGYLEERAMRLFGLIIEYLEEARELRSATEIDAHFARHFGVEDVTTACEYLADRGLLGKASTPVRLTRRSNVDVQELAFFYLDPKGRGSLKSLPIRDG